MIIEFDKTLISDELRKKQFVCNIDKCKGACCVEGDLGAPLEKEELAILDDIYAKVKPYMNDAGRDAVEVHGKYVLDWEDEYSTPTVDGAECAYAIYDENNVLKCAIEQAHNDGKIDYQKPISCHLYPVRLSQVGDKTALNYDVWDICGDACTLGESLKVSVFQFLKGPLTRKFGEDWYNEVEEVLQEMDKQDL